MESKAVITLLTLAFVFSCGCITQQPVATTLPETTISEIVCNASYIRFQEGCCLDTNGNSICDRDEAVSTTLPSVTTVQTVPSTTQPGAEAGIVCNPPYIRFANTCCLDLNSNSICDKDEVTTTTPTTAATTTTAEPTTTEAGATTTAASSEATTTTTSSGSTTTTSSGSTTTTSSGSTTTTSSGSTTIPAIPSLPDLGPGY